MTDAEQIKRLQLLGLKTMAEELDRQLKVIHAAACRLLEVPLVENGSAEASWVSDFVYGDVSVDQVWINTASYREAK